MKRNRFYGVLLPALFAFLALTCCLISASNPFCARVEIESADYSTMFEKLLSKYVACGGNRLALSVDEVEIYESGYKYAEDTNFGALLSNGTMNMFSLLMGDTVLKKLGGLRILEKAKHFNLSDYLLKDQKKGVISVNDTVLKGYLEKIFNLIEYTSAEQSSVLSKITPSPQILSSLKGDMEDMKSKARIKRIDLARELLAKYYQLHRTYSKQMASFYYYLAFKRSNGRGFTDIPVWGTTPDKSSISKFSDTDSATHTEFMMVYKILQDAGMSSMEGGLLQMNSVSDFEDALKILKEKLPAEIYSVKAMCPVCEAFLTSLYNVCGCEGVFISNQNDYDSPSGPEGALQKVYLYYCMMLKELAYLDLAIPDNRKKSTPGRGSL